MQKNLDELKNQHHNVILDSVADGVFTVDHGRKITSFNKAAEDITGIKRRNAIGKFCYEVFRANICEGNCALERTMKTGRKAINKSVDIINTQGEKIPISISTALFKDAAGSIIGGVETFRDLSMVQNLKREIEKQYSFQDILSKNFKIRNIFNVLPDISESGSTVLIEGPSGSGKELFARAIHNLSKRRKQPLVVINCGSLPDTLLESELFGYVKGAFTDAKKDKPGRFALAEGGTLFLDEIGDISPALQVRLLRVLQEREYEPLGSEAPVKANVRIIAATNKNLKDLLKKGVFRDDLYYRLNVVKLELPSLAERKEDVPILVEHFIRKLNLNGNKNIEGVSEDVLALFMQYNFPGNIRELENILEYAYIMAHGSFITSGCLPVDFIKDTEGVSDIDSAGKSLKATELDLIKKALDENGWNRLITARQLGIDKTTLWRKMKRFNITRVLSD